MAIALSYGGADTLTATLAGELPNTLYSAWCSQSVDVPTATTDAGGNASLTVTGIPISGAGDDYNRFFGAVSIGDANLAGALAVATGDFLAGVAGSFTDPAEAWSWDAGTDTLSVQLTATNIAFWFLEVQDPDFDLASASISNGLATPPNVIAIDLVVDFGSGPQEPPSGSVAFTRWNDGSSGDYFLARTTDSIIHPTPPTPGRTPRPGCTNCGSGMTGTILGRP